MYLIRVIPLSRGIAKEELSYFSSRKIERGMLVTVPVRKRTAPALVIAAESAASQKASLRASAYSLKKIEDVHETTLFTPAFIDAATETARYFATTTGEVLRTLVPKAILRDALRTNTSTTEATETGSAHTDTDTAQETPQEETPEAAAADTDTSTEDTEPTEVAPTEEEETPSADSPTQPERQHQAYIFQADDDERFSTYKSVVREEFAKGRSVFFCVPTIQDAERIADSLERGISEYIYTLHSGLSAQKMSAAWRAACAEPHPVLIVATGTAFALPRTDIGAIIVDKEHSESYNAIARPYIDIRTFAEYYARKSNTRLIMGDLLLRLETLWRHEQRELLEFVPLKYRLLSTGTSHLIDMRAYRKERAKDAFRLFSDDLLSLIERTKHESTHGVLLASRKGMHPITICSDCGTTVTCTHCSAPLVLHGTSNTRSRLPFFLCHTCGARYSSETECANCGSWHLTPLGIGTERIEQALHEMYPDLSVFRLDGDTARTHAKAKRTINAYFAQPGSILVATEMALYYLTEPVPYSAVVSVDSLLTIPDYQINEKIFTMLCELRAKTRTSFLIQTRTPDAHVFTHAVRGNLIDFYRDEIAQRKVFSFPPFSIFIKITSSGKKAHVKKTLDAIENTLTDHHPARYVSFIEEKRGRFEEHLLLQIPREKWIDPKLLEELRALPPSVMVRVAPLHLL